MVQLNIDPEGSNKKLVNLLLLLLCTTLIGFLLLQLTAVSYLIIMEIRT